jgi:hypothetical protein
MYHTFDPRQRPQRGVFSAGGRVCATPLREGGDCTCYDTSFLTLRTFMNFSVFSWQGIATPRGIRGHTREQDVATTATHASAGKSAAQRWQAEEHGAGVAARGALSTEHYL